MEHIGRIVRVLREEERTGCYATARERYGFLSAMALLKSIAL